jgi:hypothetical protein
VVAGADATVKKAGVSSWAKSETPPPTQERAPK